MFKNVTVIGSGLMGSAIAAHLTNAGCNVNLLDIVIDKSKNRLLAIEDLESEIGKNIKPQDVEVIEIAARSVAMCVFLQQKNLLQNISNTNTRSDQSVVNYDEDATL